MALFLLVALGVVMLSLGLALEPADFRRVMQFPRAVVVALLCQTVLLPVVCFLLAIAFSLPAALAVGLMLLAASPGGIIANVFSHLADGDLALNITLTAVNSLLSVVTLPLILAVSLAYFMNDGRVIPPQFGKIVQVFAIVLVPVAVGMLLRSRFPAVAARLSRPVRVMAALFLLAAAMVALTAAWATLVEYFPQIGAAVLTFNLISLVVGYGVPRWVRLGHRQSVAISMEIGLHNGALAITIAMSPLMLNDANMAVPPSVYGVLSLLTAAGFAYLINRLSPQPVAT